MFGLVLGRLRLFFCRDYTATHQAIASLVSDRSARRPTRPKPSTELVLARQAAC
ncbi:hypothetical protein P3T35_007355 [Kitasatospora sp. GP30]|nr:hypothetical protein [Kitasatospora sp. GP30]